MKPEVSLQRSQGPTTGICLKPNESSPGLHTFNLRSVLILSTHVYVRLPNGVSLKFLDPNPEGSINCYGPNNIIHLAPSTEIMGLNIEDQRNCIHLGSVRNFIASCIRSCMKSYLTYLFTEIRDR